MIPIQKHKVIAILIYACVLTLIWFRDGEQRAQGAAIVLGVFLIMIVFNRLFIWFASWGPMESLASDRGRGVPVGPAILFFWCLYVIAILFLVFKWSLY